MFFPSEYHYSTKALGILEQFIVTWSSPTLWPRLLVFDLQIHWNLIMIQGEFSVVTE